MRTIPPILFLRSDVLITHPKIPKIQMIVNQ
mgnify:CR=1 FL=1